MTNAVPKTKPDHRKKLIAAIHAEKTRRGIEDDDYRAMLDRLTGKTSAKDCNASQLGAVLTAIRGQSSRPQKSDDSPYIKKARALWKSLYTLGVIGDASDKALTAFARRQLGIDALAWISPEAAFSIIEPLRDMCRRAGYTPPSNVSADKAAQMLIAAQLSILYPDGAPDDIRDWIAATPVYGVINALGGRIRAAR